MSKILLLSLDRINKSAAKGTYMLKRFPLYGWIGGLCIAAAWSLNWGLSGLRTHLLFFPLWFGYVLVVDALVYARKGTSLLSRSRWKFSGLFFISAPVWWLFELLNSRTQNWFYLGRDFFSDFEYGVLASISFSTVIPAVFETAELAASFAWIKKAPPFIRVPAAKKSMIWYFFVGLTMLAALLLWPRYCYGLIWLSVFFIIEPINVWIGNRSLFDTAASGDWRPVWSLWIGVIICGFFWEMWNFYSYPKWFYTTPFVQFAHVFEMPMIGYLGYLPFSLELFAIYHLIVFILQKEKSSYLDLI